MNLPTLSENAKNWIQAASWLVAVAAGVIGFIKILIELKLGREQRKEDLRWRKAQAAKTMNDEMLADILYQAATTMLDWDGREFEFKPGIRLPISTAEMLKALRTTNTTFSDKEAFIRDAFDGLFYYLGIFEHYISTGLVDLHDLEHPIEYYVMLLSKNRPIFENYINTYGFKRGLSFLERFKIWRDSESAPTHIPPNPQLKSDPTCTV